MARNCAAMILIIIFRTVRLHGDETISQPLANIIIMTSTNGKILRYWPFVQGIHRSPVNSPHKGQWRGALMFSLICAWITGWVNNGEAGDLRRHRAHYDVINVDTTCHAAWWPLWELLVWYPITLAKWLQHIWRSGTRSSNVLQWLTWFKDTVPGY